MEVFDCHLHVENGIELYNLPLKGANIIFNEVSSYKKMSSNFPDYFHSLIFDYKENYEFVFDMVKSKKINALKIHSRLQQIGDNDYDQLFSSLQKLDSNIPIIYDAFYYGHELSFQPSLKRLVELATLFPNTKIIVAHAGGHHVLEYFFHLRGLKNIGYDLSFSLQYLEGTSAFIDFKKLLRHTKNDRLFWGSDFPNSDPKVQLDNLLEILTDLKFSSEEVESICTKNWLNFCQI